MIVGQSQNHHRPPQSSNKTFLTFSQRNIKRYLERQPFWTSFTASDFFAPELRQRTVPTTIPS